MPLRGRYDRVRSAFWPAWAARLRSSAGLFPSSVVRLRRPALETVAVTVLVVALFFQRLDHYLYLVRGFPIPDITFALAGVVVLAYAAVLAYRGKLDLRRPSRAELTVVALFVVFGLVSVAAVLAAQTPPKRASGLVSKAIFAAGDHPYDVAARNARVVQLRNVQLHAYFMHVTPVRRRPAVVGFRLRKRPIPIDQRRSYTYSVQLSTTSAPVRLAVVLRQWSPGSKRKAVVVTRHVKVRPDHWVRVDLPAEPAPGARVLEPFIVLPRLRRKTTLLLGYAQLVSAARVPLAIPTATRRYRLESKGVTVRQDPSGSTGWWTVVARSRPGTRGIVRFRPSAHTLLVHHAHAYTFTAQFHSSRPTTLVVGVRRPPGPASGKPFETTERVALAASRWTQATLTARAFPGKVLEPFVVLPRSARPTTLLVSYARLTRRPPAPRPVLTSHFSQSVKTIAHFAYLALIALLVGRILTPFLLRRAFAVFFVLAVGASILAALQAVDQNVLHTGISQSLHLVSRGGTGFVRPCSIFSEPALLGYFALLGALVGIRMQASWRTRWVWPGVGVCLLAILLAAAAGPIVALVPVALYLAWRASRVWRRFWRELAALAVVAIGVLVFLPAGKTLTTRANAIISGSDNSAQFRYAYDSASVRIWELAPMTGVGLGNSRFYMPSFVDLSFDPYLNAQDAQFQSVNSYLGTLSESGIFGLLMLVTMLVTLFWPLGRRRRDDAWLTEAAILLFIVAFFFISAFSYPIFWFWVGARLAQLHWQAEPERVEERAPKGALQPDPAG